MVPVAYLTAQTLSQAPVAVEHSGVRTVPELFEVMHAAGKKIFGVVLPWGMLDCSRQLTAQYAHELMLFHQRNHKNTPESPETHKMSSDTIMTLLQVRPFWWWLRLHLHRTCLDPTYEYGTRHLQDLAARPDVHGAESMVLLTGLWLQSWLT